jgi:tRNA threonylcarbamoyladenosine biosynthesis protein TsaE
MSPEAINLSLIDSHATDLLGESLARALPNTVFAAADSSGPQAMRRDGQGAVGYFHGELGAGKTTCVRSLLRTLGVARLVRSPTYSLLETYRLGALTCVHVDLYRVQTLTEIDELGLRDLVGPSCLMLIEWPERGGIALPPADLELLLRYTGEGRHAHLSGKTALGTEWVGNLVRDNSLTPYLSNLT